MNNQDVTVNQMQWQPALLKLTTIPHGDVDGGEPTLCYVNPQWIVSIERKVVKFSKIDEPYHVMEPPEVVAGMRDRAFGHVVKLGAA